MVCAQFINAIWYRENDPYTSHSSVWQEKPLDSLGAFWCVIAVLVGIPFRLVLRCFGTEQRSGQRRKEWALSDLWFHLKWKIDLQPPWALTRVDKKKCIWQDKENEAKNSVIKVSQESLRNYPKLLKGGSAAADPCFLFLALLAFFLLRRLCSKIMTIKRPVAQTAAPPRAAACTTGNALFLAGACLTAWEAHNTSEQNHNEIKRYFM